MTVRPPQPCGTGAAEDPQTTLALNFGSTLMKKKSDPEGPALLFPESELSIRIGRAGLLSGKLFAADTELSQAIWTWGLVVG
uniref:Solute carrier family 39 member 11 n=1 Tax=Homo sapiens TaxID=9606 RepID=J3QRN3_HUMAN